MYYDFEDNKIVSLSEIRKKFPNTSFTDSPNDEVLEHYHCKKVIEIRLEEKENFTIVSKDLQILDGVPTLVQEYVPYSFEKLLYNKIKDIEIEADKLAYSDILITGSHGDVWYKGGAESASSINGAISIAKIDKKTTVDIWDRDKITRNYPIDEAEQIVYKIATTYSNIMYTRNEKIKKARSIEADVLAGTRPMPTIEEVIAELPIFGD